MAEGDITLMNNLKQQLLLKTIDFVNDEFKMALYDFALATPDGAPVYIVASEIACANYIAGGKTSTGNVVTQDDVNNLAKFDLDNITWMALGAHTILQARMYDNTTATKWVLCYWEIAQGSKGNNYTLRFGAAGVFLVM
jgi:hypothetical protein